MTKMAVADAGALPDAEVVRRVLGGEPALFEVLMRRHNPRIYRAVRGVLREEHDAEDAMQQAYLQAYTHLRDFQGASSFATWLTRIAVNEALQRIRRRGPLGAADELSEETQDLPHAGAEGPEDRAAAQESMRLLERAVDGLPPAYRTVFMLRELEQLSTEETASSLGISEEAVKVRLHRARRSLRDTLAEAAGHPPAQAFAFLAPRCDRVVAAVLGAVALLPAPSPPPGETPAGP
jgi:RNA polymerase sigma-70 factor (ECF subfamily)